TLTNPLPPPTTDVPPTKTPAVGLSTSAPTPSRVNDPAAPGLAPRLIPPVLTVPPFRTLSEPTPLLPMSSVVRPLLSQAEVAPLLAPAPTFPTESPMLAPVLVRLTPSVTLKIPVPLEPTTSEPV